MLKSHCQYVRGETKVSEWGNLHHSLQPEALDERVIFALRKTTSVYSRNNDTKILGAPIRGDEWERRVWPREIFGTVAVGLNGMRRLDIAKCVGEAELFLSAQL